MQDLWTNPSRLCHTTIQIHLSDDRISPSLTMYPTSRIRECIGTVESDHP